MTSLAAERAEQARWKLLPRYAGLDVFDRLMESEFTAPRQVAAEEARTLAAVVEFAVARVPWYRDLFSRLGLAARDVRDRLDLQRLPVLGRRELREGFERFRPDSLPPTVEIAGATRSSGSTGAPVQVLSSVENNQMFTWLNQRQLRWFRRDPARTLATLRHAENLPQPAPGRYLADGEILRTERWTHVGTLFETGPNFYFNLTNPLEAQLEWLRRARPDYLLSTARGLEHLGMAAGGERPCASLLALTAISEPLTPAARSDLEAVYGARVQHGYGLNEIGLVAAACEAGRYHVHREHCLVEIVDPDGAPAHAGESGRVVVTALRNLAMPLIRYDTDDVAVALAGPCPCGRTLPAFGEILGRYSRIARLPAGTRTHVEALLAGVRRAPVALRRNLRRMQVRQSRGGDYALLVETVGGLAAGFEAHIERAFMLGAAPDAPRLAVREVANIASNADKFEDFVSEYS